MPRFVVQEHFTEPHHFDLMLERGETLATWAVPVAPEQAAAGVEVAQLGEHRRVYLDYEGEVSGGRGHVKIHDRGTYEAGRWAADQVGLTFAGGKLAGEWRLVPLGRADAKGRPLWRWEAGGPR